MFKDFIYRGRASIAYEPRHTRFVYTIIDDLFEETAYVKYGYGVWAEVGMAVIEVYAKRNLPVAPNLAAAFVCLLTARPNHGETIQSIIHYNREYTPNFDQYEEELKKYLTLL